MARLDQITFSRVTGDVTFSRGEYVKVWLAGGMGGDRWCFGYITGLRDHGDTVVVDGLPYERGRIYKAEAAQPKIKPTESLSRVIAAVNRKHDFEFTEADRVCYSKN